MNERLFTRLAEMVEAGPVVLASVVDTRGATPRKSGSRMLIAPARSEFSVGGGEAEARVIAAARSLLETAQVWSGVRIDLSGAPGAAGVCGGAMRIVLRRWDGAVDRARAQHLAAELRAGREVELSAADVGADPAGEILRPDVRLLIVGGGHCGLALYDLARHLEFDLWVHDERADCFDAGQFARAQRLSGDVAQLARALDTGREVYAVLLNRDFAGDVAALRVLSARPPQFLGMMGSRRRIGEVLRALPEHAQALSVLQAPVGLEIDAQTPHEIAVSILAQLIRQRRLRE